MPIHNPAKARLLAVLVVIRFDFLRQQVSRPPAPFSIWIMTRVESANWRFSLRIRRSLRDFRSVKLAG
ncbi:MAG TPA: hypothetical protein DDW52_16755 [Planctomycetaceae bacterium]|nr:hypothetical protein [Planctomycetaceae bacterium]